MRPSAESSRCARCNTSTLVDTHGADPSPKGSRRRCSWGLLTTAVVMAQQDLARLPWCDVERIAREAAVTIGSHGDDLMYGGKHCAPTFAALARGLAAISFAPGGVRFCGEHWCARHPESTSVEGQYRRAA